jgi:hypothetical protein
LLKEVTTVKVERSRQGGKKKEAFDKAHWKGKTCFKCDGKDHQANHCRKSAKAKKTNDDDNEAASSAAQSLNKLKKDFKKMSKAKIRIRFIR